MERREFLVGVGAAVAAGIVAPRVTRAQKGADPAKLARVAIMTGSFGNILRNANYPDGPGRVLDLMDIGEMYADRYGVHNVELQHTHLPSTEEGWLKEFRARLAKTKSRVSNINLEFGPMNISAPEPVLRIQAIDLTKRWIEHAIVLGSPRVMINQGAPAQDNKAIAIATFKAMSDYGKAKGIMVAVENRGSGLARQTTPGAAGAAPGAAPVPPAVPAGPPAHELLVEIIKGAGAYANCDMGNFPDQPTQHAGIRLMFPLTDGNAHVKLNPQRYDMAAAIRLAQQLGYKGLYSVEASTTMGPDPYENVQKVYEVILGNI